MNGFQFQIAHIVYKAFKVHQNDTTMVTNPWDFQMKNIFFNFCVVDSVGVHPYDAEPEVKVRNK